MPRKERSPDPKYWWSWNSAIRFYGFISLVGTKTGDAVTTAIGLYFIPGVVEVNPIAERVFAESGTVAGLVVLSFLTVSIGTLSAEWLAVTIYRKLGMNRLALLVKIVIYGSLSILFGVVAISNAYIISQQVQAYFAGLLVHGL